MGNVEVISFIVNHLVTIQTEISSRSTIHASTNGWLDTFHTCLDGKGFDNPPVFHDLILQLNALC